MKIFRLQPSYIHGNGEFRAFSPVDDKLRFELWDMDGSRKGSDWDVDSAVVRIEKPKARQGDFLFSPTWEIAMTEKAAGLLSRITDAVGELLPMKTRNGEKLYLLNVGPAIDCIDHARTRGERLPGGNYLHVDRYEFNCAALPEVSLFRAAEECSVFAIQGSAAPDMDFKGTVERLGLRGLRFLEVWNDDGDPVAEIKFLESTLG